MIARLENTNMTAIGVPLGPFLVLENGGLALRLPKSPPNFSFSWRERRFVVCIHHDRMVLGGPVGRLPSTSSDGSQRAHATALLRALSRALPEGWRLHLLPDHRIRIEAEHVMHMPTTASALMTPVVRLLLRAAPLMDLLAECGLG
jgi:hypothetical protein